MDVTPLLEKGLTIRDVKPWASQHGGRDGELGENCRLCVNWWRNLQDMRKLAARYAQTHIVRDPISCKSGRGVRRPTPHGGNLDLANKTPVLKCGRFF